MFVFCDTVKTVNKISEIDIVYGLIKLCNTCEISFKRQSVHTF